MCRHCRAEALGRRHDSENPSGHTDCLLGRVTLRRVSARCFTLLPPWLTGGPGTEDRFLGQGRKEYGGYTAPIPSGSAQRDRPGRAAEGQSKSDNAPLSLCRALCRRISGRCQQGEFRQLRNVINGSDRKAAMNECRNFQTPKLTRRGM